MFFGAMGSGNFAGSRTVGKRFDPDPVPGVAKTLPRETLDFFNKVGQAIGRYRTT